LIFFLHFTTQHGVSCSFHFGGHDCKIIHKESPESVFLSSHFLWIHTLGSFLG
jgi:hypothetical protein